MLAIVSVLRDASCIVSFEVIEHVDEESVKLLKIHARVIDGSYLFITEVHTAVAQKYSYHWQSAAGTLLIRWDNAPHWKNLITFPHHRHEEDNVLPSPRILIEEVISIIRKRLDDTCHD